MNEIKTSIDHQLKDTLHKIHATTKLKPKLGFILGSGLSHFASTIDKPVNIAFTELPHFAGAGVEGHPGQMTFGHLANREVVVLQGRLHAYEGHDFNQVIYPIRTLAALGVETVVVTNSAGGLNKTMRPGDFMVISDHINLTGQNPLRGPNWPKGPRFVDMTEPYDKKLSVLLKKCLLKEKARVTNGVYVGVMGPTYETAAEIRFFSKIGGAAVGMSTIAEVIAARHAGLRVVGLSCITNLGTGLAKHKLTHDDVKTVAQKVESTFTRALLSFTKSL